MISFDEEEWLSETQALAKAISSAPTTDGIPCNECMSFQSKRIGQSFHVSSSNEHDLPVFSLGYKRGRRILGFRSTAHRGVKFGVERQTRINTNALCRIK